MPNIGPIRDSIERASGTVSKPAQAAPDAGMTYQEMLNSLVKGYGSLNNVPPQLIENLNAKFGRNTNADPVRESFRDEPVAMLTGLAPADNYVGLANALLPGKPHANMEQSGQRYTDNSRLLNYPSTPSAPVGGTNQVSDPLSGIPTIDEINSRNAGTPDFDSLYADAMSLYFKDVPNAPGLPGFKANDFTDKATEQISGIYSPQFAALDEAIRNAKSNTAMSQEVVRGLYDRLIGYNEQAGEDTASRYDQGIANQEAAGQALSDSIGNVYSGSQQEVADLVKGLGGGADVAAILLAQGADEGAYQRSKALNTSQQQQNYMQNMSNTQQDYLSGIANANQSQGAAEQQRLLADLSNRLANIDTQRLGLESNKASDILNLAQQLTNQDLSIQQMNYGATQDQYQNLLAKLGLENNMRGTAFDVANTRWGNEYQVGQDNYNRDIAARQDAIDNIFKTQQLETERMKALGLGKEKETKPSDFGTWLANVTNISGSQAERDAIINQIFQQADADMSGNPPTDAGSFIQNVMQGLAESGISANPLAVRDAAQSYYTMMGGSMGWPYT